MEQKCQGAALSPGLSSLTTDNKKVTAPELTFRHSAVCAAEALDGGGARVYKYVCIHTCMHKYTHLYMHYCVVYLTVETEHVYTYMYACTHLFITICFITPEFS